MEKVKDFFTNDIEVEANSSLTNQEGVVPVKSLSSEYDPLAERLTKEVDDDAYAQTHIPDDSPYPEVRAAVSSFDDPTIPQNTWRMWVLGMMMTTIGSAMNVLFSMHSPSFYITALVTSMLAWPIGRAWQKIMPNLKVFGIPLNPGAFNLKEHALITIMANVSFGSGQAYATAVILALNQHYGVDFGWGFDLVLIWSSQCIGFAYAGMMRKILVEPSNMIWPSNLVLSTFLTNIHVNDNHTANGWQISRLKFFLIIFLVSFFWYWFPGYIFKALSYFAWPTWIAPNNVVVNQVFGAYTGLGLIPLTFDWNQISSYIGSPLVPPISTIVTIFASMVIIFWIVTPALHYTNTWFGRYLPMSSSGSYDRFQKTYNVSRIINSDLSLNLEKYKEYSPLYLSTTFAVFYGMSFASFTSTIVHAVLFHGADVVATIREWKNMKPDVHSRLMKQYKNVPEWWYAIVFVIFFGMSVATIRAWNTEMPVWSLVVALCIAIIMLIPAGIIHAITNISVGLNVITEVIVGYMIPGKPIAMMLFKTYGYITNFQAIQFTSDMKLGNYMKISPRLLFTAQFTAAIWGSLVQIAVLKWAQGAYENVCSTTQVDKFTCPGARTFFNASIIWGVIGPQRQYSHGQTYYGTLFFFIIGAILPIINWLILKKWPNSYVKYLNWPVFFSGTNMIPPATPYNYGSYCVVGIFFGWFIKKKWFHWWSKYNYSLSAGLDIGLAWSSLLIFLTISLTKTAAISWWGNNITDETMDMTNTAIQEVLAAGDFFGPASW
ncbi:unnamed protein product [Kuraishia capsulata CBS 1993]|uniref:OPT family small oligopeptide transporter n=1 Tax=Kuraishia capsulata CBS 1993 TaxID=1382522 RepID=W6MFS1_9ASCO|nr:uncharacterized protein KUCA_T00000193001 [Kuraishia capsulata CBS 1993]CDK24233.1 unnamed protein product [Kuraishia capsulata CBS 1993]